MNIISEKHEAVNMDDANEKLCALQEAKRYLELALEEMDGTGENVLMDEMEQMIADLDDAIVTTDMQALEEAKIENGALTRAYFQDAIGSFNSLNNRFIW